MVPDGYADDWDWEEHIHEYYTYDYVPHPPAPPHAPPLQTADRASNYLLTSWMISVGQRFVINEPVMILIAFFLPICFANECMANCCGESVNNFLTILIEIIIKIAASLKG